MTPKDYAEFPGEGPHAVFTPHIHSIDLIIQMNIS